MARSNRNSAIELLRIIAMFMIVFHHFALHGGFNWDRGTLSIPFFWYHFMFLWGKIGIAIFILISGYYLIKDDDLSHTILKILKFWGQLFFYSLTIYLLFVLGGKISFNLKTFLRSCLPITSSAWGFASNYFMLLLLHPFLNKMFLNLKQKSYQILLIIFTVLWSIIPTFIEFEFCSSYLLWLIYLYGLAGYVRLYGFKPHTSTKSFFLYSLGAIIVTVFLDGILIVVNQNPAWPNITLNFYGLQSIFALIIAFTLFISFSRLKMSYKKGINLIGSTTFGIYLIHDNELMRNFLWFDVFKNNTFQNTLWLIPYSILVTLLVFCFCALIDFIRQKTVEKGYLALVKRYLTKIIKTADQVIMRLTKIIF